MYIIGFLAIARLGFKQARPLFRTKFVASKTYSLYEWVDIEDASADLSAVGYSVTSMSDSDYESPVCFIHGKDMAFPEMDSGWRCRPDRLLGPSKLVIEEASLQGQKSKYRFADFRNRMWHFKSWTQEPVTLSKELKPVETSADLIVPDKWWNAIAPGLDKAYGTLYLYPTKLGIRVGEIQSDANMHSHLFFPVVRKGKDLQLIDSFVEHQKGDRFGQVCFVSKRGWLIVKGTRGSQVGLFWLFPVKGA